MLNWQHCSFTISRHYTLKIGDLVLAPASCTAFVGSNGSGKTLLARALCGELLLAEGQRVQQPTTALLSFERQQQLIAEDWRLRNTDALAEGEEAGISVQSLLDGVAPALLARLGITHLLDRPYHVLSSGEGRKVLLAQALASRPNLLVLDEPFDGLDVQARETLQQLLGELHAAGQALVLILNRFDEIPPYADRLGLLANGQLLQLGAVKTVLAEQHVAQLARQEQTRHLALPAAPLQAAPPVPPGPRIQIRHLTIDYGQGPVIKGLDWTVQPGEHWHILGPNGCGKSTLLSVVTGDHPQGYSNDVTLFGRRRGSGETIWDIKRQIGYVSPALHLDYRVSATPLDVVLSGFFDSIGLYEAVGDDLLRLARQWLDIAGMLPLAQTPFHRLSFGQQRLLLILRAMVKHPTLLILDEPLQGLDPLSRWLVQRFVEYLMRSGRSQILFVSHHADDAPQGLTHQLRFELASPGEWHYVTTTGAGAQNPAQ